MASRPVSVEETIAGYERHYSIEEQNQFGVLAIEICVTNSALDG